MFRVRVLREGLPSVFFVARYFDSACSGMSVAYVRGTKEKSKQAHPRRVVRHSANVTDRAFCRLIVVVLKFLYVLIATFASANGSNGQT